MYAWAETIPLSDIPTTLRLSPTRNLCCAVGADLQFRCSHDVLIVDLRCTDDVGEVAVDALLPDPGTSCLLRKT